MKIVGISDMHLLWEKPVARLDDTKSTCLNKLNFILNWCSEEDAILVVAGDFFNKPRSWYLLPEVMRLLKKHNVRIYAVSGQHDTYMYSATTRQATNLGILEQANLITILGETPICIGQDVRLFGASYGQPVPEYNKDKKREDLFDDILVIHAPIAEVAAWPGQNYMDAIQFLKEYDFDYIFCGDIHQKFIKEIRRRYIMNSGPLIRKEATVYNFQHRPGFFVIDTESRGAPVFVEVPHQSAELVLTRSHIDYKGEASDMLSEFIESVQSVEIDEDISIIENIWRMVQKNKIRQEVVDILSEVMEK